MKFYESLGLDDASLVSLKRQLMLYASENLIKINVFFDTLNQHIVEDKIDYAIGDGSLVNALGGCLSLWLGLSFCNLFEILELILDLLGNLINQMLGRLIGTNVK